VQSRTALRVLAVNQEYPQQQYELTDISGRPRQGISTQKYEHKNMAARYVGIPSAMASHVDRDDRDSRQKRNREVVLLDETMPQCETTRVKRSDAC
jgi:hypothetical protein